LKFQELDLKQNDVLDYDELVAGGYVIATSDYKRPSITPTKLIDDIDNPLQQRSPVDSISISNLFNDDLLIPTYDSHENLHELEMRNQIRNEISEMRERRNTILSSASTHSGHEQAKGYDNFPIDEVAELPSHLQSLHYQYYEELESHDENQIKEEVKSEIAGMRRRSSTMDNDISGGLFPIPSSPDPFLMHSRHTDDENDGNTAYSVFHA
jgi:hypothetical protein